MIYELVIEREPFRWSAARVDLTEDQSRRMDDDPDSVSLRELKVISDCGHLHRDAYGDPVERCLRRLQSQPVGGGISVQSDGPSPEK